MSVTLKKKRFLYIGGFKLPDKNAAAHRVIATAKLLKFLGYEVVFLDVSDEIPDRNSLDFHKIYEFETYSQKHPKNTREWIAYMFNVDTINTILDKYDDWVGVIAYNYPAIGLKRLMNICKSKKIKIFSDCTEWYQICNLFSLRGFALFFDTFFRMRVINKQLDGIIVISEYLYKYYHKELPTIVLPPLIDSSDPKWSNIDNNSCKSEKVKLIYAGSSGRNKKDRLDVLINAIKDISNVELTIIGITKEEYLSIFYENKISIERLERKGIVEFRGRISHIETLKEVKKSDFSIFYREENRVSRAGFPTKFVESVSCSVPVLTNNTSDLAYYLEKQNMGTLFSTTNFYEELKQYLTTQNIKEISKNMKAQFNHNLFDYRKYSELMSNWLNVTDSSK